jgi:hypothetical protein
MSNLHNINHQYQHGYGSKSKDACTKNVGTNQKVNVSLIPSSSNKAKSTSYSSKPQGNNNNPVLLKLIDRSKIKGYM